MQRVSLFLLLFLIIALQASLVLDGFPFLKLFSHTYMNVIGFLQIMVHLVNLANDPVMHSSYDWEAPQMIIVT